MLSRGKTAAARQADALSWLTLAAENDHAQAQYELGRLYDHPPTGAGFAEDPDSARAWWERAAAHGNGNAMRELALRFAEGVEGFPRQPVRFRELSEKIADGYEKGRYGLARDVGMARELYERLLWAYENGHLTGEVEEKFIDYQRWRLEVVARQLNPASGPGS